MSYFNLTRRNFADPMSDVFPVGLSMSQQLIFSNITFYTLSPFRLLLDSVCFIDFKRFLDTFQILALMVLYTWKWSGTISCNVSGEFCKFFFTSSHLLALPFSLVLSLIRISVTLQYLWKKYQRDVILRNIIFNHSQILVWARLNILALKGSKCLWWNFPMT